MMINRLTTDRVSLGETARGNTNEKTTQQTSRFVVWSFFACLINDCHRDIVLNFCKEFCVKTFFRKDSINNRLRNVIFNTNFMFGNTFCYIRGTISNCKVRACCHQPPVATHKLFRYTRILHPGYERFSYNSFVVLSMQPRPSI